jgi:hypothetical protein
MPEQFKCKEQTNLDYFRGPRIRLAFVPLPLAGAALILYTLISGHHLV